MSSPDGSNNHPYPFNVSCQSPSAVIRLNRTTFVTMPTQYSQTSSIRPLLIRPINIPVSQHHVMVHSVIPVTSVIRPQRAVHFKVTSAGKVITPRSSMTPLNQTRPLARRPLTRPSGKVLCSNCGIQSADRETCESCRKNIERRGSTSNKDTVRNQEIEDGLRATKEEIERTSRRGIPSSSFYNGKVEGESDFARYVRKTAVNSTPSRPQRKRPHLKRNTAAASESVCITISSDSEEEDELDSSPVSVQAADSSSISNDQSKNEESETPNKKQRRDTNDTRAKPVEVKFQPLKPTQQSSAPTSVAERSDEDLAKATLNFKIESVRIGQMKLKPTSVLRMSQDSMAMTARCSYTNADRILTIKWANVAGCEICADEREPCLYLLLHQGSLPHFREQLEMEKGKFPYYDPLGEADEKYFILYICRSFFLSNTSNIIIGMFRKIELIRKKLKRPSTFFCQIGFTESEQRQMLAAAGMEQDIIEETEQSLTAEAVNTTTESNTSSPAMELTQDCAVTRNKSKETHDDLKFMFTGPRVELFVYPPPPTTGGISVTNEDQFCLNDGEFLNDVIIEFYLKYVYDNILSDEDRERSHIFSCFFYERLMQKSKKLKDVSQAERRHSQVKKWTRNEDIFSKDFIFIPINEASHWYLAVICFPGLDGGIVEVTKPNGEKVIEKVQKASSLPLSRSVQDSINHDENKDEGSNAKSNSDKNPSKENEDSKIQPMKTPEQALDKIQNFAQSGKHISTSQPKPIEVAEKRRLVSVKIPNFTVRKKKKKISGCEESIFFIDSCRRATVKPNPETAQDVLSNNTLEEVAAVQSQSTSRTKQDSTNFSEKGEDYLLNSPYDNRAVLVRKSQTSLPIMNTFESNENAASLTSKDLASSSGETDVSLGEISASVHRNRNSSVEPIDKPDTSVSNAGKSVCNIVALRNRNTIVDIIKVTHPSPSSQSTIVEPTHLSPSSQSTTVKVTHPSTSSQSTIVRATHPSTTSQSTIATATHPSTSSQSIIVKVTHPSTSSQSTSDAHVLRSRNSAVEVIENPGTAVTPYCGKNTTPGDVEDSTRVSKHKKVLLEIYVNPGSPAFVLPKELKDKCSISPSRMPEVRMPRVSDKSPIKIKYRVSETPIRTSLSLSSDDSVIILSSSDHSDSEATRNTDGPHTSMEHATAQTCTDLVKIQGQMSNSLTPLNLYFETSSHDLSDCDVVKLESSLGLENSVTEISHEAETPSSLADSSSSVSLGTSCETLVVQTLLQKACTSTTVSTVELEDFKDGFAENSQQSAIPACDSASVKISARPSRSTETATTQNAEKSVTKTIHHTPDASSSTSIMTRSSEQCLLQSGIKPCTSTMMMSPVQNSVELATKSPRYSSKSSTTIATMAQGSEDLGTKVPLDASDASTSNMVVTERAVVSRTSRVASLLLKEWGEVDSEEGSPSVGNSENGTSDSINLLCEGLALQEVNCSSQQLESASGKKGDGRTISSNGPQVCTKTVVTEVQDITPDNGSELGSKTGVKLKSCGPNSDENLGEKDGADQVQKSSTEGNEVSGNISPESSSSDLRGGRDDIKLTDSGCAEVEDIRVFKRPCILIFDSLRGPSRSKIATSLREYLSMEWKTRKERSHGAKIFDKDTLKMCSVLVPQQDNYTDCGLFLLHYVEKFFTKPIANFSLPVKLDSWFDPEECNQKRTDIKKVIDKLHNNWTAEESGS